MDVEKGIILLTSLQKVNNIWILASIKTQFDKMMNFSPGIPSQNKEKRFSTIICAPHRPPPAPRPPALLNANILFGRLFLILTRVWPNSGFWCCNFLSLQIALIYVPINTRSGNTKREDQSLSRRGDLNSTTNQCFVWFNFAI